MKISILSIILGLFLLTGCGGKEEPAATETADTGAAAETMAEEAEMAAGEASEPESKESGMMNSLMASAEKTAKSMGDSVSKAMGDPEEEMATAEEEMANAEEEMAATEEAGSASESMMDKAMKSGGALASSLDFSDMSWAKVPKVSYADRLKLAAWATEQAQDWKGKLTEAAMDKGTSMLQNLGDSGWQGALKQVMDAIQGVKEANPETWELARGALVSAWDKFQTEATKVLGN